MVLVEDVVLHTGRGRFMEHGLTSKSALVDAQHLATRIAYFTMVFEPPIACCWGAAAETVSLESAIELSSYIDNASAIIPGSGLVGRERSSDCSQVPSGKLQVRRSSSR